VHYIPKLALAVLIGAVALQAQAKSPLKHSLSPKGATLSSSTFSIDFAAQYASNPASGSYGEIVSTRFAPNAKAFSHKFSLQDGNGVPSMSTHSIGNHGVPLVINNPIRDGVISMHGLSTVSTPSVLIPLATPIPEADNSALILAGLAVVAWRARRRIG
jgi:hypothetical protein